MGSGISWSSPLPSIPTTPAPIPAFRGLITPPGPMPWMGTTSNPGGLGRAYDLGRRAVQLDPNLPEARAELGRVLVRRREHDAAVAEFERAITLNPNFTDWRFAEVLVPAGQSPRAI